jgi:hypothetical protein
MGDSLPLSCGEVKGGAGWGSIEESAVLPCSHDRLQALHLANCLDQRIGMDRAYDRVDVTEGTMRGELKAIRSEADYKAALAEMKRLWGARLGTREGERLDVLAALVDAYESEHDPMNPPGPPTR